MATKLLAGEAAVRIVPSFKDFKGRVRRELESTPAEIKVGANLGEASLQVAAWRKRQELDKLNIKIDADGRDAIREYKKVEHVFSRGAFRKALLVNIGVAGVGAVQGLIAAAGSAAAAIDALGQSLTLLPGALSAAGAAAAVLKASLGGIGDAFSAAGTQATDHAKKVKDSAAAGRDVQKANRDVTRSMQDVGKAYRDAGREIEDLNHAARRSSLTVAGAALNLQESLDTLAKGGFKSVTEYRKAQLSVLESTDDLAEAQKGQKRAGEDAADANKKGVAGSDQVVSALDAVADAQNRVTDAMDRMSEASAATDFDTAIGKLAPNAQDFVQRVLGMKGAWKELQQELQNTTFQGTGPNVEKLLGLSVKNLAGPAKKIAAGLSDVLNTAMNNLGKGSNQNFLANIFNNSASGIHLLAQALSPLTDGLLRFFSASSEKFPTLIAMLGRASDKFNAWITKIDQSGELSTFLDRGIRTLENLGSILTGTVGLISNVAEAWRRAGGSDDGFIGSLARGIKGINDSLEKPGGLNGLVDTFRDARDMVGRFLDFAKKFAPFWETISSATREWLGGLLSIVGVLAQVAAFIDRNTGLLKVMFGLWLTWKTIAPLWNVARASVVGYNNALGALGQNAGMARHLKQLGLQQASLQGVKDAWKGAGNAATVAAQQMAAAGSAGATSSALASTAAATAARTAAGRDQHGNPFVGNPSKRITADDPRFGDRQGFQAPVQSTASIVAQERSQANAASAAILAQQAKNEADRAKLQKSLDRSYGTSARSLGRQAKLREQLAAIPPAPTANPLVQTKSPATLEKEALQKRVDNHYGTSKSSEYRRRKFEVARDNVVAPAQPGSAASSAADRVSRNLGSINNGLSPAEARLAQENSARSALASKAANLGQAAPSDAIRRQLTSFTQAVTPLDHAMQQAARSAAAQAQSTGAAGGAAQSATGSMTNAAKASGAYGANSFNSAGQVAKLQDGINKMKTAAEQSGKPLSGTATGLGSVGDKARLAATPLDSFARAGGPVSSVMSAMQRASGPAATGISAIGNAAGTATPKIGTALIGALKGVLGMVATGGAFMLAIAGAMALIQKMGEAHRQAAADADRQKQSLDALKGTLDGITGAVTVQTALATGQQATDAGIPDKLKALPGVNSTDVVAATNPTQQPVRDRVRGAAAKQATDNITNSQFYKTNKEELDRSGLTPDRLAEALLGDPAAKAVLDKYVEDTKARAAAGAGPGGASAARDSVPDATGIAKQTNTSDIVDIQKFIDDRSAANQTGGNTLQQGAIAAFGKKALSPAAAQSGMYGPNPQVSFDGTNGIIETSIEIDPASLQALKDQGIATDIKPLPGGRSQIILTPGATQRDIVAAPGFRNGGLVGFKNGGLLPGRGGLIRGNGSGTSDSVPMDGSRGEFVLRKAAVDRIPIQDLHYANRTGKLRGFNIGGFPGLDMPLAPAPLPPPIPITPTAPGGAPAPAAPGPSIWGNGASTNVTPPAPRSDVNGNPIPEGWTGKYAPGKGPTEGPFMDKGTWAPGYGPDGQTPIAPVIGGNVGLTVPTSAPTVSPGNDKGPASYGLFQSPLAPGGSSYGLPAGTNIGYGQPGFPDWVYQLGSQYGVKASTYAGHQEGSGQNRGIDFDGDHSTPEGAAKMDAFATAMINTPGVEQVIWENPFTGQKFGKDPGDRGANQSIEDYYRDDWANHENHVHVRTSTALGGAQVDPLTGLPLGGLGSAGLGTATSTPTKKYGPLDGLMAAFGLGGGSDGSGNDDPFAPDAIQSFLGSQIQSVGSTLLGVGLTFIDAFTGLNLSDLVSDGQEIGNFAIKKFGKGSGATTGDTPLTDLAGGQLAQYSTQSGLVMPGLGTSGLDGLVQQATQGGANGTQKGNVSARYKSLVDQIGQAMGVNTSTWTPALLKQIETESGGDPTSVNDHDTDGKGGTQTVKGLLNFLPSTFESYKVPGFGSGQISDPVSQIAAAINYVQKKWHGTPDAPRQIGNGEGFAAGGMPDAPYMGSRGEFVFNAGAAAKIGSEALWKANAADKFDNGGFPGIGPGNVNPKWNIDTSNASVAPAYDRNRLVFNDLLGPAIGPNDLANATHKRHWGPGQSPWASQGKGVNGGPAVPKFAVGGFNTGLVTPKPKPNFTSPPAMQIKPAAPKIAAPPSSGGPAPSPGAGALPQIAAAIPSITGGLTPPPEAAQAPDAQQDPRFMQIAPAPESTDHLNPAIKGAIQGGAAIAGNIASMAAAAASFGASGVGGVSIGGGGGGGGSGGGGGGGGATAGLISGATQIGSQIATGLANVVASAGVGTLTSGTPPGAPASGTPLIPERPQMSFGALPTPAPNPVSPNVSQGSGGGITNIYNGGIHTSNLNEWNRNQQNRERQQAQPITGKYAIS